MSEFETLLELSGLDTHLDQLGHRRANDPLRAAVDDAASAVDATAAERAAVEARRDAVRRDQSRLEDEVATLEDKIAHFDAQLYDGSVTAHKELEAIQAEIAHLGERKSGIEDGVIVQMELAEPLDAELAALAARRVEAEEERDRRERELIALEAELDAEMDELNSRRGDLVSGVGPGLLDTYESLRSRLTPAAVRLAAGGRCEGCHLELPRVDYDRAKRAPADEVLRCPECDRILVR